MARRFLVDRASIAVVIIVIGRTIFFSLTGFLRFEFARQRRFDGDMKVNIGRIDGHFITSQGLPLTIDQKLGEVPMDIAARHALLGIAKELVKRNGVNSGERRACKNR